MCLDKFEWLSSLKKSLSKTLHPKLHIAVKYLIPCFLTTFVHHKYLEVFFEKSGAYKSKYIHKPLLSQNMVHLLEEQSQRPTPKFTCSPELKSNSPLRMSVLWLELGDTEKYSLSPWETPRAPPRDFPSCSGYILPYNPPLATIHTQYNRVQLCTFKYS